MPSADIRRRWRTINAGCPGGRGRPRRRDPPAEPAAMRAAHQQRPQPRSASFASPGGRDGVRTATPTRSSTTTAHDAGCGPGSAPLFLLFLIGPVRSVSSDRSVAQHIVAYRRPCRVRGLLRIGDLAEHARSCTRNRGAVGDRVAPRRRLGLLAVFGLHVAGALDLSSRSRMLLFNGRTKQWPYIVVLVPAAEIVVGRWALRRHVVAPGHAGAAGGADRHRAGRVLPAGRGEDRAAPGARRPGPPRGQRGAPAHLPGPARHPRPAAVGGVAQGRTGRAPGQP